MGSPERSFGKDEPKIHKKMLSQQDNNKLLKVEYISKGSIIFVSVENYVQQMLSVLYLYLSSGHDLYYKAK